MRTDEATGRVLRRAFDCEVAVLLALDRRSPVWRDPASGAPVDTPSVVRPGAGDLDGAGPPHRMVLLLGECRTRVCGWLLGRSHRAFGTDDVAHAELLGPGLRQRLLAGVDDDVPAAPALTARECDVLELIGAGLTSRVAARRLGISERTVQKHLEHAYSKLGCSDRVSAMLIARSAGLLPAEPPW